MSTDERGILEQRAQRLAQPPPPPPPDDLVDLVVFGRSGARYAVNARFVREVRPLAGHARLPHAPEVLLGVTSLRSRTLPLLETDVLIGQRRPETPPTAVVVLADEREPIGLTADRLVGVETVSRAACRPASDADGVITGTTPDGVTLLSGDTILDLPPLFSPTAPTSPR